MSRTLRPLLFLLAALASLQLTYGAARCVEIEFKPTKGICKDESYKTKRCMTDAINVADKTATNMFTAAYAGVMANVETVAYLNNQAQNGRTNDAEMDESWCVRTLQFQYTSELAQKTGQCSTTAVAPSGIDWFAVPLAGLPKTPGYGPPEKCDCKDLTRYFVDLMRFRPPQAYTLQPWWFGHECDYDQQCAIAEVDSVEQPYDRICCDSYENTAKSYCKDYQESQVNLFTDLLKTQTADWWRCFDDQCIKASSSSSVFPGFVLSVVLSVFALLRSM